MYDLNTNTFQDTWGNELIATKIGYKPTKVNLKVGNYEFNSLKINLGLRCNFNCEYCSQVELRHNSKHTTTIKDLYYFIDHLDDWLKGIPKRIEMWGGETLLYINYLKILIPFLREKFPNIELEIKTNGSLLTKEIVDFLIKYNVILCISYDTYGQSHRGIDILKNNKVVEAISYALDNIKNISGSYVPGCYFHVTYNKEVADPAKAIAYLSKIFGRSVPVNTQMISGQGGGIDHNMDNSLLETFYKKLIKNILFDKESPYNQEKDLNQLFRGFNYQIPLDKTELFCNIKKPNYLFGNIKGDVYSCTANMAGNYYLGSVYDPDNVKAANWYDFHKRVACMNCPVATKCRGACPAAQGNAFVSTCYPQFYRGLAFLFCLIYKQFDLLLVRIEGITARPKYELIESKQGSVKYLDHMDLPIQSWEELNSL